MSEDQREIGTKDGFRFSRKTSLSTSIEEALSPIIENFYGIKPHELKNADKIRTEILTLCDLIDVG